METLQPEDIKKLNEANIANQERIDVLIDKNYEKGFSAGIVFERGEFNKKLNKAINDSIIKGGMVNGDCYLSLDLLNKYLKVLNNMKNKQKDWEKELYKLFGSMRCDMAVGITGGDMVVIKDFISQVETSAKEELKKEIVKMILERHLSWSVNEEPNEALKQYNRKIEDIIDDIKLK